MRALGDSKLFLQNFFSFFCLLSFLFSLSLPARLWLLSSTDGEEPWEDSTMECHEKPSISSSSSLSCRSLSALLNAEEGGDENFFTSGSSGGRERGGAGRLSFPLFLTVACDPFHPWTTVEHVQRETSLLVERFASSSSAREGLREERNLSSSSFSEHPLPPTGSLQDDSTFSQRRPHIPEVYIQEIWASDLCRGRLSNKVGTASSYPPRLGAEEETEEEEEEKKRTKWFEVFRDQLLSFVYASARRKKVLLLMQPDVWFSDRPLPPPASLLPSSSFLSPQLLSCSSVLDNGLPRALPEKKEGQDEGSSSSSTSAALSLHRRAALSQRESDSDEDEDSDSPSPSSRPSLSVRPPTSSSYSSSSPRFSGTGQKGKKRSERKLSKSARDLKRRFWALFRWLRRALLYSSQHGSGGDVRHALDGSEVLLSSGVSSSFSSSAFSAFPSFTEPALPVETFVVAVLRLPFEYMKETQHPLYSLFKSFFPLHFCSPQAASGQSPGAGQSKEQEEEEEQEEEDEEHDDVLEFLYHLEREKQRFLQEEEEGGMEGEKERERRERSENEEEVSLSSSVTQKERANLLLKRIEEKMNEERKGREGFSLRENNSVKKKNEKRHSLPSFFSSSSFLSSRGSASSSLYETRSVDALEEANRLVTSHSTSPFERVPLKCFWPSIHVECACCVCCSLHRDAGRAGSLSSSSSSLGDEREGKKGDEEEEDADARRSRKTATAEEEEEGAREKTKPTLEERQRCGGEVEQEGGEDFDDVGEVQKISPQEDSLEKSDVAREDCSSYASPPSSCLRCMYTTCPRRGSAERGKETSFVRSVLIGGPPGCGKSVLMHVLSDVLGGKKKSFSSSPQGPRQEGGGGGGVIFTHVADLLQPYVGASQRRLLDVFASAVSTFPPACVCIEGLDVALGLKGRAWKETGRAVEGRGKEGKKKERERREREKRAAAGGEGEGEENRVGAGPEGKTRLAEKVENEEERRETEHAAENEGEGDEEKKTNWFSSVVAESSSSSSPSSDDDSIYEDFESDEDSPAHQVQRDLAQYFQSLVEVYVHRMGVPLCCTVSVKPESLSPPDVLQCFNKIVRLKPIRYH